MGKKVGRVAECFVVVVGVVGVSGMDIESAPVGILSSFNIWDCLRSICLGDSVLENVLKSIDHLGILFEVMIDDG